LTDGNIDSEEAERLAKRYLTENVSGPDSDVETLVDLTERIATTLEQEERPDEQRIGRALRCAESIQENLEEIGSLFSREAHIPSEQLQRRETELIEDESLVALRANLEDGLSQVQHQDANQEDVAQLLELYAGYVRDGHICPPSQRGSW